MKYYCIGIKGAGMSSLAQCLYDLGNEVFGYDDKVEYKFTEKELRKRNIKIYHDSNFDIPKDTIVTYSVAVDINHPEIKRVQKLGLKIKKYNEIIGDITKEFDTICVSGTHGKTTTTGMIKHILENNGGCNYFVGAGDSHISKNNNTFVIEADEFNKHFLPYQPSSLVITNIEKEHLECYENLEDIINTFETFANKVSKHLVVCGDNSNNLKIKCKNNIIYYGFNENNDYIIKNNYIKDNFECFDIYYKEELFGSFTLPLIGKHMVLNATAAIIMCYLYNISIENIKHSLKSFVNASRRFVEESIKDTIIIDDYAHHPTEIKMTISAIKRKYPDKKVVVVFKPNTYSRFKYFKDEFIDSFTEADKIFITDVYSDREKQEDYPGINSDIIIKNTPNAFKISIDTLDELVKEKNSVICFMSCAYIEDMINKFKELL